MAKVKLTPRKKKQPYPIHDDPYQIWSKNLERVQATNAASIPESGKEYTAKALAGRSKKGI